MFMRSILVFSLAIIFTMASKCPSGEPKTCTPLQAIHVKAGATGGDGKTWATAYGNLQDALNAAKGQSATGKVLVAIAQGEYKADPSKAKPIQDIYGKTHQVVEALAAAEDLRNVEIRGGFTGADECLEDQKPELATKTVLNGKYADQGDDQNVLHVLQFEYKSPEPANLTLSSFSVQNGKTLNSDTEMSAAQGAGLFVTKAKSVRIENLHFANNIGVFGGAVSAVESEIQLLQSKFEKNRAEGGAPSGGAIWFDAASKIVIEKCDFVENQSLGSGGAIIANASLQIDGGTFDGNTSKYDGGAISRGGFAGSKTDLAISNATFTNNKSENVGGAIAGFKNNMTFKSSVFKSNEAVNSYGGAVHISDGQGVIDITNSTFEDNRAVSGGAILHESLFGPPGQKVSILKIQDSAFRRNIGTSIETTPSPNGGGAIVNSQNAELILTGVTFEENKAFHGGAVLNQENSKLTASGGTFARNEADKNKGQGGAIAYLNAGDLTANQKVVFEKNTAYQGGAVAFGGTSKTIYFDDVTFRENKASPDVSIKGSGGAILSNGKITIAIHNGLFEQNEAYVSGAIDMRIGTLTISQSRFLKNLANQASGGGAIRIRGAANDATLDVTNSDFENNQAGFGGAISASSADLTVADSSFKSNMAQSTPGQLGQGGAIYNGPQLAPPLGGQRPETDIQNSTFTSNTASTAGGAIFNIKAGNLKLHTGDKGKFTQNNPAGNVAGFNGLENAGGDFNEVP